MIVPRDPHIYVAKTAVDLRWGIDRLAGLVAEHFGKSPRDGKALGVKDLRRFDEKALKLMMLAFISLSRIFYPLSEKEMAQGYCDLFLGVSPLYPAAKFAWLLELKYLPAGTKGPQIERAFAQAAEQVARYAGDERLVPLLTRGRGLKVGGRWCSWARRRRCSGHGPRRRPRP